MTTRTDRINRFVLTVLALVLLAGGAAVLVLGTDVLGAGYDSYYLLPQGTLEPYVVLAILAAVLLVVAVVALKWLVLQVRTARVSDLEVSEDRTDGETHVRSSALVEALEDSAEQVPGVASASAKLVRRRGSEVLVLRVQVLDRTDLAEVRERLADGPIAQVRAALEGACPALRLELEPTSDRARTRELA